jgi:hypothetical protein
VLKVGTDWKGLVEHRGEEEGEKEGDLGMRCESKTYLVESL